MDWNKYSWETPRARRGRLFRSALHTTVRLLARLSPVAVLQHWSASRWMHEDYAPTRLTSFADWCLWKLAVGGTILRCFFCWGEGSGADDFSHWWTPAALRLKAIVCLLLGRHWRCSEREHWLPNSETVLTWNWRRSGYYEVEYDSDRLDVANGWRDWRVTLDVQDLRW
jgi:hypothetical protein